MDKILDETLEGKKKVLAETAKQAFRGSAQWLGIEDFNSNLLKYRLL